jgi:hypothetical protein
MVRLLVAGFALALLATSAPAQDKKDPKEQPAPVVWERESEGVDLRFEFGQDALKLTAMIGENGFVAKCKVTIDKEGLVKAKFTSVEEKGSAPAKPSVGDEFSFKWKVNGDKAVLSELKGENVEDAKAIVEGEYKKKKK